MRLRRAVFVLHCLVAVHASAAMSKTVSGGSVHFYGAAVNASCTVDAQSLDQSVMMDQVKVGVFSGPGTWAPPTAFGIKLENCSDTISQFASIAFTGEADPHDPQVFRAGYGADAATGVGIGIFDDKDNVIIPNATPVAKSALSNGENMLMFNAKYRSVSPVVTSGSADAVVNFAVIYQ
ncbi:fimbrial protein [Enterobacter roggenkampii]|uniref:fimbrial protein n=1 Tax=Enterobacter roggenkampii TaxID=1812935 RepID=UPI0012382040|nr:fimbrial protein [Enterobacter roggenkampii]